MIHTEEKVKEYLQIATNINNIIFPHSYIEITDSEANLRKSANIIEIAKMLQLESISYPNGGPRT